MKLTVRTVALTLLLVALAYAVVSTLGSLNTRVQYELGGAYTYDTHVQWAHGRAIAEGARPYVESFDFKPLGITYLVSWMFQLTGDYSLSHILQALVFTLLALLPGVAVFFLGGQPLGRTLALLFPTALLFGIGNALFVARHAGEFSPESFSILFLSIYVVLLASSKSPERLKEQFCFAVVLFLAVSFRETAVPVACALALLFSQSIKSLWYTFGQPLLIAVLAGFGTIAALGVTKPFLTMYAKNMAILLIYGTRTQQSTFLNTVTLQTSGLRLLFADLYRFSPSFAFWVVLLGISVAATQISRPAVLRAQLVLILRFILAAALLFLSAYSGIISANQHRVMIAPSYLALFLLLVQYVIRNRSSTVARWLLIGLALCAAIVRIDEPAQIYAKQNAQQNSDIMKVERDARKLDRILDACRTKQYLYIGDISLRPVMPAFTTHRPIGPLFFQQRHFIDGSLPILRRHFLEQLQQAKIVVCDAASFRKRNFVTAFSDFRPILDEHFTAEAPSCVPPDARLERGSDFQILFRKESAAMRQDFG